MATIGVIIGAAIANAVAFTGGNANMHAVDGSGNSAAERERHDRAIEELNKANVAWNEKRQKTLDYLNRRLHNQQQSQDDFADADQALRVYNLIMEKKPKLSDFYAPSEPQKQGEYLFIGSVIVTGVVTYKFM
jgi:hypothetical protein